MIFELAKKLRNNVTATEMILWGRLKDRFPELKFRRQHPISLYVVDFYCHGSKLVLEIDGSIHDLQEIKQKDEVRQKDLEELGITVLRFTNDDILNDLEKIEKKFK